MESSLAVNSLKTAIIDQLDVPPNPPLLGYEDMMTLKGVFGFTSADSYNARKQSELEDYNKIFVRLRDEHKQTYDKKVLTTNLAQITVLLGNMFNQTIGNAVSTYVTFLVNGAIGQRDTDGRYRYALEFFVFTGKDIVLFYFLVSKLLHAIYF